MSQLLSPTTLDESPQATQRDAGRPSVRAAGYQSRCRVAFLTNEIPPYRVPLYQALADTPGWEFRVFTCVDREMGRMWDIRKEFPFSTKRSYSLSYVRRIKHTGRESFDDERQIHLPVGHLWDLWRYRPDVIISGEFGARTLIGAMYARLFNARLVVYSEGTPHTERSLSAKQRWLRRLIRRSPRAYLVNGRQGTEYLESIHVANKSIFEIGQAIDPESFAEELSPEQRDELRAELGVRGQCFLCCGALIPRKGIDHLLDAWETFCKQTEVDATLLLAGDGPERERLEQRVADAQLTNVRFLGHLQRDQLPAIYHAADAFVFPTLEDCWALAVNEAMVAGLPVISSKYTGSADLIFNGVTGWVVDPLERDDLARGLRLAWEARHERSRMSPEIRRAVATMTIPAVAERVRKAVDYARRARSVGDAP